MLNREIAPAFKQVEDINLIEPQEQRLKNNISVFTISGGTQNLIKIEFIFENVNWDAEKPLQTSVTNAMLNEGTHSLTAAEIASKIDYYGAFLQTEFGLDRCSVILYTLKKHLSNTLPIVKEVLTGSIFPEKELEVYVNNQKQRLKVSLEKNDFVARKTFNHLLFAGTLYGYDVQPEDYDQLSRNDLLAYYEKCYHPQNCTIVASGNIDESLTRELDALFGEWQSDKTFTVNNFEFGPIGGQKKLVEKPDALQSAIRLGVPTIKREHPDFPGFQVLNTILGGYFGSRLMANIREDKGYTYGIGSGNASLTHAGFFFIASQVGTEVCSNTLIEIEKEINLLKSELVQNDELDLVKNFLMGSLLGSLENAFSHADKFKNIYFSGLGYEYYQRYMNVVKNISSAELKDLANKYLDYEGMVKVIVGKE